MGDSSSNHDSHGQLKCSEDPPTFSTMSSHWVPFPEAGAPEMMILRGSADGAAAALCCARTCRGRQRAIRAPSGMMRGSQFIHDPLVPLRFLEPSPPAIGKGRAFP